MSNILARTHDQLPGSDRRSATRQPIRSLAYVELDEGNGGIILNIGEGGMSVQAVTSLMDDFLPEVRFQLAETESWIEAKARITWASQSRKLAGLEFIGLSEESRGRIREWLGRETEPQPLEETARDAHTARSTEPAAGAPTTTSDAPDSAKPSAVAPEPNAFREFPVPAEQAVKEVPETVFKWPKSGPASPALADLLESVSDRARQPAPPPSPVPAAQPSAQKRSGIDRLIENNWSTVTVLLFLALASLLAGWAAGQGAFGRYLSRIHLTASRTGPEVRANVATGAEHAANQVEIEVVSASNQRWTIPFNGPLSPSPEPNRRQVSPGPSSNAERKPDAGFRTWIVTPPSVRSSATAQPTNVAPPALPETPAGENVLTSSGALNARAVAGTPNLPVPAPSAPAGVIKQGQLIYRVDPVYPTIAKEEYAEGTVRLNVTIGPDGVVRGISLLGGPRLLIDAAERAVRQWRYSPTLLDGKPVEFQREVDLTFRLATTAR